MIEIYQPATAGFRLRCGVIAMLANASPLVIPAPDFTIRGQASAGVRASSPRKRGTRGLNGIARYARQGLSWVAIPPVSRAEHRARPGVVAKLLIEPEARKGSPACWRSLVLSYLFAPGELGERPAEARRAGDRAQYARRRDRGVLSLGDFSLHEQREVTQGAGAEPPAHSCSDRARSARSMNSRGSAAHKYASPQATQDLCQI